MDSSESRLLENLCRTCMGEQQSEVIPQTTIQKNKRLISIYNEHETNDSGNIVIMELLKQTIPQLTVETDDVLPKTICLCCLDKLLDIHEFQNKSLRVEQRMQDIIKEYYYSSKKDIDPLNIDNAQQTISAKVLKLEIDGPLMEIATPVKGFFNLLQKDGEIIQLCNTLETGDEATSDRSEKSNTDIGNKSQHQKDGETIEIYNTMEICDEESNTDIGNTSNPQLDNAAVISEATRNSENDNHSDIQFWNYIVGESLCSNSLTKERKSKEESLVNGELMKDPHRQKRKREETTLYKRTRQCLSEFITSNTELEIAKGTSNESHKRKEKSDDEDIGEWQCQPEIISNDLKNVAEKETLESEVTVCNEISVDDNSNWHPLSHKLESILSSDNDLVTDEEIIKNCNALDICDGKTSDRSENYNTDIGKKSKLQLDTAAVSETRNSENDNHSDIKFWNCILGESLCSNSVAKEQKSKEEGLVNGEIMKDPHIQKREPEETTLYKRTRQCLSEFETSNTELEIAKGTSDENYKGKEKNDDEDIGERQCPPKIISNDLKNEAEEETLESEVTICNGISVDDDSDWDPLSHKLESIRSSDNDLVTDEEIIKNCNALEICDGKTNGRGEKYNTDIGKKSKLQLDTAAASATRNSENDNHSDIKFWNCILGESLCSNSVAKEQKSREEGLVNGEIMKDPHRQNREPEETTLYNRTRQCLREFETSNTELEIAKGTSDENHKGKEKCDDEDFEESQCPPQIISKDLKNVEEETLESKVTVCDEISVDDDSDCDPLSHKLESIWSSDNDLVMDEEIIKNCNALEICDGKTSDRSEKYNTDIGKKSKLQLDTAAVSATRNSENDNHSDIKFWNCILGESLCSNSVAKEQKSREEGLVNGEIMKDPHRQNREREETTLYKRTRQSLAEFKTSNTELEIAKGTSDENHKGKEKSDDEDIGERQCPPKIISKDLKNVEEEETLESEVTVCNEISMDDDSNWDPLSHKLESIWSSDNDLVTDEEIIKNCNALEICDGKTNGRGEKYNTDIAKKLKLQLDTAAVSETRNCGNDNLSDIQFWNYIVGESLCPNSLTKQQKSKEDGLVNGEVMKDPHRQKRKREETTLYKRTRKLKISTTELELAKGTPDDNHKRNEKIDVKVVGDKIIISKDLKNLAKEETLESEVADCNEISVDDDSDWEPLSYKLERLKRKSIMNDDSKADANQQENLDPKNKDVKVVSVNCDKRLKTRLELKMHLNKHSAENRHICPECGAALKTRFSLKRHRMLHETDETKIKFKCQYCNKVFGSGYGLRLHVNTHFRNRPHPYLCSICGKSFATHFSLNKHCERHDTKLKYQCQQCPKKFSSSSSMSTHKHTVHTTAKPYACDVCGASFKQSYWLKCHIRTHGEKKHKCDYCEMKFITVDQCRRHMRTHTGEKPYKCRYCERAYAQSNDMVKHLRVHLGDNVYRCELCPLAFRLLCEMRAHFALHVNDDDETKQQNLKALKEEEQRIEAKIRAQVTEQQSS